MRRAADRQTDSRTFIVRSGDGHKSTGDGMPSDTSNANAGACGSWVRRRLAGPRTPSVLCCPLRAGTKEEPRDSGAGGNDTRGSRIDLVAKAGEPKSSYSLSSSGTVIHMPVAFAFVVSTCRCTMHFVRLFRGFARVAERTGDGGAIKE